MTAYETVEMVRMLLDDQTDYALSNSPNIDINSYINNAQNKTIAKYYRLQDERALRPLYVEQFNVINRTLLNGFLYPRGCHIKVASSLNNWKGINAKYVEYDEFLNEDSPEIGPNNNLAPAVITMPSTYPIANTDTARMPITSKWTVVRASGIVFSTLPDSAMLLFTWQTGGEYADVMYIAKPTPFLFNPNNFGANVNLALPKEYHYEIAALAAHLITMGEVNEFQRESSEYAGAKLDFNTMRL